MKNYSFTESEINAILGDFTPDPEATASITACDGGQQGWGKDSTVGLTPECHYIVALVGFRAFDPDFVNKNPRAKDMANNMVVRATQVAKSKTKGITALLGEPIQAVVGGRALCGASVCTAQDKAVAAAEKRLYLLSFVEVDKGQKNEDGSPRMSKVYTSYRLSPDDLKNVKVGE